MPYTSPAELSELSEDETDENHPVHTVTLVEMLMSEKIGSSPVAN